jgi:hypothetical protein
MALPSSIPRFVSIAALISLATAGAAQSTLDEFGRPSWVTTAKAQATLPTSSDLRAIQNSRATYFNSASQAPPLDVEQVDGKADLVGGFHDSFRPKALPTDQSDAVAVAQATAFQPYLSSDHSRVYAELQTRPLDIVADRSETLNRDVTFVVLQEGGTLILPNGKVVSSMPFGGANPIQLAKRYLLFLKYHPTLQAFTVVKSWDLSGDRPIELDYDGHPYTRPGDAAPSFADDSALISEVKQQLTVEGR